MRRRPERPHREVPLNARAGLPGSIGVVRLLPAALLLCLTAPALAGPGATASAEGRVTTLSGLKQRIHDTQVRFDALVERAKQDPRTGAVEAYLAYKSEDFENPKRSVRVANLLAIVGDESAPEALRRKAREAIASVNARSFDPDLQYTGVGHSKRAAFSAAKVVALLGAKSAEGVPVDEMGRRLAAEILDSLWHMGNKATEAYDPKNPATWRAAQDGWKTLLQSK